MYSNNTFGGKYWVIVGPKLPGTPGDPNYRVPDYGGFTVSVTEYQPSRLNFRHMLKCVLYEGAATKILTFSDVTFRALFAKLRKATVSFVMSVGLSVRMEQLGSHWTDFHEI